MELMVKKFDELTTFELYELLRSRSEVFVVEQNCPYQDLDTIDYKAVHICFWEDNRVIANCRVFMMDEIIKRASIGRVITLHHGQGHGVPLMLEGIKYIKEHFDADHIYIHAQQYAIGFYQKVGFEVMPTPVFMEDNIPHVEMILKLK